MDNVVEQKKMKNTMKKRTRQSIFITIGPVYTWMTLFLTVPLLLIVVISFMQRGLYGGIVYEPTIKNYVALIDPMYMKVFGTSLIIAIGTTILCLLIAYPFSYFLVKVSNKYRNILMLLIIIPFWTNSLVRVYAWIVLLRSEGVINTILLNVKFIDEPIKMLYSYGAIFLGMIYTLLPFMILPLYSSIEKLDVALLEAADDLGASTWQTFRHVTLPLTIPGIIAGSLLVFIPSLGYFFIPDLMGGGKHMIIGNLIKNQFLTARNWPFGSALALILILITLGFVMIYLKLVGGDKDDMGVM
ncbi:MAG: spermidine/putrescine ABC transporter permease [Firmicutes bacterium HGW-Firmicutes-7]|nr:MAG: spermidine/putrescine ABC transporter permease [Firmicutes bacterium HGW-Firmicutes-7]